MKSITLEIQIPERASETEAKLVITELLQSYDWQIAENRKEAEIGRLCGEHLQPQMEPISFLSQEQRSMLEYRRFWSPFSNMRKYNGKHFKIVRELGMEEADRREGNILFEVDFESGEREQVFLEEINGDYLAQRAGYAGEITPEDEFQVYELYPPNSEGTNCYMMFAQARGNDEKDLKCLVFAKNQNEALGCCLAENEYVSYYELDDCAEI